MSYDPYIRATGINVSALRLDPITMAAINSCHLWEEVIPYPWECIPEWKRKDARGLDLAIWYEEELCGLCYATPRESTICIKNRAFAGPHKKHPPFAGLDRSNCIEGYGVLCADAGLR